LLKDNRSLTLPNSTMNATFLPQFGRLISQKAIGLCALCGCLSLGALAADPEPAIDFNRAQQLFNRAKQGEKLSPEDQTYLDRAKVARREGKAIPNRGHTAPPPPRESTGLIPLNQMTAQENYKGQDGGLYGGGNNQPPASHLQAALAEAAKIVPLDADGKPAPQGRIVLLSLGMSNTTMEYSVFKKLADADPAKASQVTIVDGAQSGKDAEKWNDTNSPMWQIAEERLRKSGVTPQQVEAVWFKQARIDPALYGEFPKHNDELNGHIIKDLQIAKIRYPNLRIVYLSTRIYGGYALTGLNPEPYAYENGFAIRDLILRQCKGDAALNYDPNKGLVKAPLLLWGPYLWADGVTPRKSDGLVWKAEDFRENDRTHPSAGSGQEKVAKLLLGFLKSDSTAAPWFLGGGRKPVLSAQ
jgi:hypothetical protein